MADHGEDEPQRGFQEERRRVLAAAFLFAAVVGVLILGAALRAGRDAAPRERPAVPEPPSAPEPAASLEQERVETEGLTRSPAEASAEVEPPPPGDDLARRAAIDPGRLAAAGEAYTVQLMVSCDAENARRVLDAGGERVYLIPAELQGRRCYRLCWGSYPTRSAAQRADDLPGPLRSGFHDRQARPVSDLLP